MPGQNPAITSDYPKKVKPNLVRWMIPGWGVQTMGTTGQLIDGQIYYQPIFVEEPTTYIRVGVTVTNLREGATLDLRLFADNNGVPGALIEDFGSVSLAVAAIVEIVINRLLARGYYWLARRTDGAGAGANLIGVDGLQAVGAPVSGRANICGGVLDIMLCVVAAWADPAPAPNFTDNLTSCAIFLRET